MIIDAMEMSRRVGVERPALQAWISAGWIHATDGNECFTEGDEAKARLILDLVGPMGVNDEGVGVILDLLEQIHGLRRLLVELHRRQQALDAAADRASDNPAGPR